MSQSTRITGQTNKSKHRPSKRRQAGRKGTVDEWEYLLGSMGRLVARVDEKSGERFHFSTYFDMVKTETVYRTLGCDFGLMIQPRQFPCSDNWS